MTVLGVGVVVVVAGGIKQPFPHAAAALILYKYLLQRAETVASVGPGDYGLMVVVTEAWP